MHLQCLQQKLNKTRIDFKNQLDTILAKVSDDVAPGLSRMPSKIDDTLKEKLDVRMNFMHMVNNYILITFVYFRTGKSIKSMK